MRAERQENRANAEARTGARVKSLIRQRSALNSLRSVLGMSTRKETAHSGADVVLAPLPKTPAAVGDTSRDGDAVDTKSPDRRHHALTPKHSLRLSI